jgi:hypothetical protein
MPGQVKKTGGSRFNAYPGQEIHFLLRKSEKGVVDWL